jgi:type I restriction enzyme S subunit
MSREAPEGWCAGKFGKFITLQRGFDLPVQDRQHGAFSVIASNGQIDSHSEARISGPAVVTGRSGTLGKVFYLEDGCWPLNTTLYVKNFHGNDPEFVSWFLKHIKLERFGTGTGVPTLNRNVVHEEDVVLPPLHEQRRIAKILSSVDDAIAATRAVIEQTRKVKQGVLERLLTKGIDHTRFKQTEIGEIPEGWEVAALGELSEFVTSGSRGWAAYYSDNGDLFLRIANLTRSSIRMRLDEIQKVSLPQGSTEGARTRVGVGDILISITADLGIIGHVFEKFEHHAYVNQHIALVRPLAAQVSSAFLAYALSGPVSQRKFQHLNDAGAKAGLNLPTIRRFSVPLPPLDEQRQIVESLSSIDDAIDKEEKQLRAQIKLKSALMSDVLTGRKRVTDTLPMAAE